MNYISVSIFFKGFFQLMCSKSCCVYFHKICWKKFKNLKYPGESDEVLHCLPQHSMSLPSPCSFCADTHLFFLSSFGSVWCLSPWHSYFMGKFNLKVGIGEELVSRYSHVSRDRVSVKVKSRAFFCINYLFYCHGYFVTLQSFKNFISCKQEKCP